MRLFEFVWLWDENEAFQTKDEEPSFRPTAKVSRPQNAGRLDCRVRPEGQKGTPGLEDARDPRKSAEP